MTHLLQIEEPTAKRERAQLTPAIGIDLGTTHSLAAIVQDGRPVILTDLIPSIVGLIRGQIAVGRSVIDDQDKGPTPAVYSVKRLMGLTHTDLDQNVRSQYNLNVSEQSNVPYLKLGSHQLTAVALSAQILKHLKVEAESVLGHSVDQAVITVPAYFNDAQRQATKDAAEMAGLTVIRLLNEPTAAAVAYGLDHQAAGIYAIYDLGGGTFDFSILKFNRGIFQVLATGGDTALGGDDFDQQIVQHLLQSYPVLQGIDAVSLRLKAKQLKHDLSQSDSASFEFIQSTVTLSRGQFESIISTIVDKTINIVKSVLCDAHLSITDIKGVVMVGGATRIPLIREKTQQFFQQDLLTQLDPDTIVASGAAIQAHALTQGSDTLLLDVVPLSLGVEMMGGVVERIIERNTAIPTAYTKIFTTQEDGQSGISLHIVQGERDQAVDCRSLAYFTFTNIPPLKAGQARIAITFSIDADGLLTVSAQEESTQIIQTVQVDATYGLSLQDMADMVRDSLDHSEQDHHARQLIESRLQGERLIEDITQACQEDRGLLTEHEETTILNAIQALRGAMTLDDANPIRAAITALNDLTHDFAARRMDHAVQKIIKSDSL